MTRDRAYAIVRRMGELEAMGGGVPHREPFEYESEAVCFLSNQECDAAWAEGRQRIEGRLHTNDPQVKPAL